MIIKHFELKKNLHNLKNFLLLHGKNEALKNEIILNITNKNKEFKILTYDENQILNELDNFFNEILNGSLFDNEKIIIIKRASDKILNIVDELINKNTKDFIILNSDMLEKKSKLRSYFEKSKDVTSIAVYPETLQNLAIICQNFFKNNKIPVSQSDINLLINKVGGEKEYLMNELNKIKIYCITKKKITTEEIIKLTNLIDNHNISELIDNCLAQNSKKTINILNENNYSNDEVIMIVKMLIKKCKRVLGLIEEFSNTKDLEKTITSARPPIFWKDKEIIKTQIIKWNTKDLKKLIFDLNDLELCIKKNSLLSYNLINDFIISIANLKASN